MADPAHAQFRTTVNANLRQDPSLKAPVVTVLKTGSIVTLDVHRVKDGEWCRWCTCAAGCTKALWRLWNDRPANHPGC